MSTKIKREAKKAQNKKMEELIEFRKKCASHAYDPEKELTITGENFYVIKRNIERILDERTINVFGRDGEVIGQGINPLDKDLMELHNYVNTLHEAFVRAGDSISIEDLKKLLQAKQSIIKPSTEIEVQEKPPILEKV